VLRAASPLLALALLTASASAGGELGRSERLPTEPGRHWVWVSDLLAHRTALVDAASGAFLGTLSGGQGLVAPTPSPDHREIYLAETHYARGTRGARTDVVTVYDAETLEPEAEVEIPPKRAEHLSAVASSALSDDGRFLAVFNQSPATSLSIVDVAERRFRAEIATPGCGLVYAAGTRRFATLCGDGSLLVIGLDDAGHEASRARSARFFDPERDPVTEKAARLGPRWLFVSFEGMLHAVDVTADPPRPEEPWSLFDDADRAAGWRVGGLQHLAVHPESGRLFALVHRGGPDTHKAPGTEVWVYDVAQRARAERFAVRNPNAAFLRQALGLAPDSALGWLLDRALPNPGADRILVTAGPEPLLVTSSTFPSTLAVHDARSGAFLRDVPEVGFAGSLLVSPWRP
jgi:methylamine dehydrogenase heavy chain